MLRTAAVGPLLVGRDEDVELARQLKAGARQASWVLVDRHGGHIRRVLVNVLGPDADVPELLQEVFVRALNGVSGLRDDARLKAWLTRIAVFVAREHIRARVRQRRLLRSLPDELEISENIASEELREAVARTYAVLSLLSLDQRIVFALRYVQGLELSELAEACGVSLATVKRRLARAETRFIRLASREPALRPWLEEGRRWNAT